MHTDGNLAALAAYEAEQEENDRRFVAEYTPVLEAAVDEAEGAIDEAREAIARMNKLADGLGDDCPVDLKRRVEECARELLDEPTVHDAVSGLRDDLRRLAGRGDKTTDGNQRVNTENVDYQLGWWRATANSIASELGTIVDDTKRWQRLGLRPEASKP